MQPPGSQSSRGEIKGDHRKQLNPREGGKREKRNKEKIW